MSVARILIWNLADSKTTLAELRDRLPQLDEGDHWIANDAQERFGLVSTSDELPDLSGVRELIGKEPEIAEEYDVI
ncbi:MAG TPA: hypothetical protein VLB89_06805 [Gaiellaceae bacterium]|nr:hypothetical protein [Gaiellaceae bacterium]